MTAGFPWYRPGRLALGGGVVFGAVAVWQFATRPPELLAAELDRALRLEVRWDAQVSQAFGQDEFEFCDLVAHPTDPEVLIASALRWRGHELDLVAFRSQDGGQGWKHALTCSAEDGERLSDSSLCIDRSGTVFLGYMQTPTPRDPSVPSPGLGDSGLDNLRLQVSSDGGRGWEMRTAPKTHLDRPWLALGPSRDAGPPALYLVANMDRAAVYCSMDEGRSFRGPFFPRASGAFAHCRHAEPAVHQDGSLSIVEFGRSAGVARDRPLYCYHSADRGEHWQPRTPVPTRWRHARLRTSHGVRSFWPRLAVGRGASAGWLFCVWGDGTLDGYRGERILFAASPDQGVTWRDAVVLSEQPMGRVADADEYLAFSPSIACAPDGTVGVSWYDRRGLPAPRVRPTETPGVSRVELDGWDVRLRASRDAGRTWGESVRVSRTTSKGPPMVGHAAALAARADGVFVPAWIDNRTGRRQLWTAGVRVRPE